MIFITVGHPLMRNFLCGEQARCRRGCWSLDDGLGSEGSLGWGNALSFNDLII
ncbi:hypothetical protein SFHH103_00258 [Sinorhizobium fredii HH103]|uniref:Uncharacterized protein n=1 Tax=Sinorhizobium fredii (strain HH103) TaxID=1117943 RepID=G9AAY0_SINF1|nr:hypothetical protein SFHH103_00258 [Sinorhizobium fredii HH103]